MSIYQEPHRKLQDQFDSRRIADRLEPLIVHDEITEEEKRFIEAREFFFLSTITPEGEPTVSFKGGAKGFVRVLDKKTIVFPTYNGNGMFFSTGNLVNNPAIGILFIDFEQPHRIRFHGKAALLEDDRLKSEFPGAELLVSITLTKMWINCPRYIPRMQKLETSPNVPVAGKEPPMADWKRVEIFRDALPRVDIKRLEAEEEAK